MMELFKPSGKILEAICGEKEVPVVIYEIYPRYDKITNEKSSILFISGLVSKLCEFYRINLNYETRSKLKSQKIWDVSGEMLENCFNHGPKNKDVWFGLFLGEKGVCYGFCDGGDYFKDSKIKNQYENKIEISEFDKSTFDENHQTGVDFHIYPFSDMIEVDSENGILYCVQFKENIIR